MSISKQLCTLVHISRKKKKNHKKLDCEYGSLVIKIQASTELFFTSSSPYFFQHSYLDSLGTAHTAH